MKKILKGLLAVAFTQTCFAAAAPVQKAPTSVPLSDPNPLERFGNKKSNNLYVTGEAVWFKPLNLNYFHENTEGSPPITGNTINIKKQSIDFDFQPGFRIALGYNTNFDGWDIKATYTRLIYKKTASYQYYQTQNVPSTSDVNVIQGLNSREIKYNYNLGDLDLGRGCKLSSRLQARPYFGIRILGYKYKNPNYINNYTYSPANNNITYRAYDYILFSSTLVGLKGGCEGLWKLSQNFSLTGNLTLSSLVNSMKYPRPTYYYDLSPGFDLYTSDNNPRATRITNNLDISIGLSWDKNFADDKYHLGLSATYEQHSYWTMNSTAYSPVDGDFMFNLQGIALGARLDF